MLRRGQVWEGKRDCKKVEYGGGMGKTAACAFWGGAGLAGKSLIPVFWGPVSKGAPLRFLAKLWVFWIFKGWGVDPGGFCSQRVGVFGEGVKCCVFGPFLTLLGWREESRAGGGGRAGRGV